MRRSVTVLGQLARRPLVPIRTKPTLAMAGMPSATTPLTSPSPSRHPPSSPLFRQSRRHFGEKVQFNLADVGEGIFECEVMEVHVKAGQKVKEFDRICDVNSDKASVEITSRYTGTVTRVYHKVGDKAKVGAPLVDIELEEGETADHFGEKKVQVEDGHGGTVAVAAPGATPAAAGGAASDKVLTSPAVRHLAKSNGVDLTLVSGTGKDGRVLKEDLLAYLANPQKPAAKSAPAAQAPAAPARAASSSPSPAPPAAAAATAPVATTPGVDTRVVLTGIRKAMVKSMTAAALIPHLGFADEYPVDGLHEARALLQPVFEARGLRLTYMPLLIKTFSEALKAHQGLNCVLEGESTVVVKGSHNIGIAMASPNGLIVPNIKNVQDRSLASVAQELARLQGLAAAGKLGVADLSGGTITISNIGGYGGTYMRPVLLPPESTIVALGAVRQLPRFDKDGKVVSQRILNASFSCDHRVIDGAAVASFSQDWKKLLANPLLLVADLK